MEGRRRVDHPPIGWWFKHVGLESRQIRSFLRLRRDDEHLVHKVIDPILPRKASSEIIR